MYVVVVLFTIARYLVFGMEKNRIESLNRKR